MGAALLVAACVAEPDPAGAARLAAPRSAQTQDLTGTPAPDLLVDTSRLAHSWVVYDQDLVEQDLCAQFEGGVTPGVHRVVRFTVTTPNVGTANLVIGNPLGHIKAEDGLFELSSCHFHFHLRHFAAYELVSAGTGQPILIRAAKKGFCMIDDTPWQFDGGVGSPNFRVCGTYSIPGNQGISVGWADSYTKHIGGQYFVLDGGDGQAPVPPGEYIIRITVNPPFECTAFDRAHNRPVDPRGMCHNFLESNYDNNVGEVHITIPDHTGKTGFGPGSVNPLDAALVAP
jgi:hypothetical protein